MAKDTIIIEEVRDTVDEGKLPATGKCQFAFTNRPNLHEIYISTTRRDAELGKLPGWRQVITGAHLSRFIVTNATREQLVKQIKEALEPKGLKIQANLL
jgi:hypothetical protein